MHIVGIYPYASQAFTSKQNWRPAQVVLSMHLENKMPQAKEFVDYCTSLG